MALRYCSAAIFLGVAAATGRNLRNQHLASASSHSSRILLLSHRRMCRVVAAGARRAQVTSDTSAGAGGTGALLGRCVPFAVV